MTSQPRDINFVDVDVDVDGRIVEGRWVGLQSYCIAAGNFVRFQATQQFLFPIRPVF